MFAAALLCATSFAHAQDENASWTFDTYTPGPCSPNGGLHGGCPAGELVRIHVVTVAHGLVRPWHVTFLPGGTDMLVTELPGNLRIVRSGKLDPKPIAGWPADALHGRSLNSVVLHPDFARFNAAWTRELVLVPQLDLKFIVSPTRLAALSRGAMANEIVSRSAFAGSIPARFNSAPIPGRGASRIRASPIRAIARFSPRMGATSATVSLSPSTRT